MWWVIAIEMILNPFMIAFPYLARFNSEISLFWYCKFHNYSWGKKKFFFSKQTPADSIRLERKTKSLFGAEYYFLYNFFRFILCAQQQNDTFILINFRKVSFSSFFWSFYSELKKAKRFLFWTVIFLSVLLRDFPFVFSPVREIQVFFYSRDFFFCKKIWYSLWSMEVLFSLFLFFKACEK